MTLDAPAVPPAPSQSLQKGKGRFAAALVVLLALGGVAAYFVVRSNGDDSITLRGTFMLIDEDYNVLGDWDSCSGSSGYDDFGAGMNVTVRDGDGNIIGSGSTESAGDDNLEDLALIDQVVGEDRSPGSVKLTKGQIEDFHQQLVTGADMGFVCAVYFEVEIQPAEFYEVSIGKRGGLTYSHADLQADGFMAVTTLGL